MQKLNQITQLGIYLNTLKQIKNRYMIFIAVQGEWTRAVTSTVHMKMLKLGIESDLTSKENVSYIAVLEQGKPLYENIEETGKTCGFQCKYSGVNINIVSSTAPAIATDEDLVKRGITINNKRQTFSERGISFVIYDRESDIVIDAVSFDTFSRNFTAFRMIDYKKILIDRLSAIHIGFGYSIAQWLYDFEFNDITICMDPQFIDLTKSATLSLKLHENIHVKNRFLPFSKKYKLNYPYANYFQYENYRSFDISEINAGETVVYLSPAHNYTLQKNVEEIGAKYFGLPELIENAYSYIKMEELVTRLVAKASDVKVVSYRLPNAKKDRSPETQRLLRNVIDRTTILQELKNGNRNAEDMSLHIKEDTKYTTEEWLELICYPNPSAYNDENGYRVLENKSGKHVNIANGHRVTKNQPDVYDNTIYIFGGCNAFGLYNADEHTFSSEMQRLLNECTSSKKRYKVENYSHFLHTINIDIGRVISSIKPISGDIIFYPQVYNAYSKYPTCDLNEIEMPDNYGYLFCDRGHFSENMHRFIGEEFTKFLIERDFLENEQQNFAYRTKPIPLAGFYQEVGAVQSSLPEDYARKLTAYKSELAVIREQHVEKIGSIVMNCNPFTLGHRYLIEYAASKVKHLFIFAVEEDKSFFPFEERFELMKKGTADLKNVTVLPSGKFIISSITFSDYFNKADIQDRAIDPSQDVTLFAKEIAPTLGITVRFAGEEPLDKVTQQYNDAMQKILPQYGVKFEVIPRKENGGGVISASRVRKLLENNDFDSIAEIVPETTLRYLKEKFSKK